VLGDGADQMDPNGVIPALPARSPSPVLAARPAVELERGIAAGREQDLAHPRTTSKAAVVPKCPTNERTGPRAEDGRGGGQEPAGTGPSRSRVKPMPAITAPAPSDDMKAEPARALVQHLARRAGPAH
jgi:hypothetical protein